MIIVTSGHVDHGKTALLQALTGTNTTHLPEEKKRGMTIDLGYAYLPLGDKTLGFIDVPGHEKFLPNMLAGLGGIHYAMLIIAIDDGIQAQTVEHLAILRQLQLNKILIVLTKADKASSSQIDALKHTIKANYPSLADSPIFVTSATTQQGIAELRDFLTTLPNLADSNKPFRYAIDRIFSVKGAGTVVTGTAFSGKVNIDDELFLSNGERVRVKNIHAQNQPSKQGLAGQRLALNIHTDIERSSIQRGDWLFNQPAQFATDRITVQLNPEIPLAENQAIHLYHATNHTVGKLSLLTTKTLPPQTQALAEIILDKPLFLSFADKLILRSGDNKQLIAGAKVIEINSPKRHKRSEVRLKFLQNLQQAENINDRIALYLQQTAVEVSYLLWIEQLNEADLATILQQNHAVRFQQWCFNQDYQAEKNQQILTALSNYHQQHPDQVGLGKARLYRIATLNQPEKLIYHFIDELLAQGKLQQTRGWLHLPEHKIEFNAEEQALWKLVLGEFMQQNGQPLWVRDMANTLSIDENQMRNFLYKAGKLGYLIPIVKDRFFLTETLFTYANIIKKMIEKQGDISVNQLRDELQFGRKLTVQLIEYFDRCGLLRRKGNVHILRDSELFN
ncbi:selenocysteine-specific translation elongation factor [Lonepinella koalarum]|uniref:Selenocysteine-specific translation elongation factor SelB n=1 Tax=Lonepinella koalarum TaxID=53417 RepID=A0A4R1L1V2_9PAST|nr:selenocysteine-specific translation elongation factor [Lonepinella koalarum]MDH2925865.1 selenocysteine-specific translation elongation factor [Lonepinella koalarum]TCK71017.1 selenocysteine-specific translation elongation factor SelB [Lonepinella koalarum]TFJ90752.1 selenocysteine-specific translation elongation factor [Lonepinella koalarum]